MPAFVNHLACPDGRARMAFGIIAASFSVIGFSACGEGYHHFTSATRGYSIDYPEGWSVNQDQPVRGASDSITTDDFMSEDKKVTVGVECVPLIRSLTVDEFLENQVNVLKLGGVRDGGVRDVRVENGRLMVAGTQAPVVDFSFTAGGSTIYFTDVLILKDCGWVISIAASTDTKMYRGLFLRMAKSFQPD